MRLWIRMMWLFCLSCLVQETPAVTLKGQRLKFIGYWDGERIVVHRVKLRYDQTDPRRGRITGSVSRLDRKNRWLWIGPIAIHWREKTRFRRLSDRELAPGTVLKVRVKVSHDGTILARSIERVSQATATDAIVVEGVVTHESPLDEEYNLLVVLGLPLKVPDRLTNPALRLIRRQDDARPEDQFRISVLGRPLIIGGEVGVTPRFEKDFKLDPDREDDRLRVGYQFQLELFYAFSKNLLLFLEGLGGGRLEAYHEGGRDKTVERRLRRGETWLFWGDVFDSGISLQIGRQRFQDRREWWWDANLDAVRLYYTRPFFQFQAALAHEAFVRGTDEDEIVPTEDDVLRILSQTHWEWHRQHRLSLFFLHHLDYSETGEPGREIRDSDLDRRDARLTWGGIRATGMWHLGKRHLPLEYWIDTAVVGGREIRVFFEDTDRDDRKRIERIERRSLTGVALDTGLILETSLPLHPTFTVAYAFGSPQFRQTGLQDNNVRFRGVDRFRLYGELLRPELSNLHILTASIGLPLLQSSSVEILFHQYYQVDPEPALVNARLRAEPDGKHRDLGQEMDVIFGIEEWKHLELEWVFGIFRAGSAFGARQGRIAWNTIFKLNYNF